MTKIVILLDPLSLFWYFDTLLNTFPTVEGEEKRLYLTFSFLYRDNSYIIRFKTNLFLFFKLFWGILVSLESCFLFIFALE